MESYEKLRQFVDSIFSDAPQNKNTLELKEEIFLNLTDKYNDFIANGKSEETAYNLTVASVGNVNELISSLGSTMSSHDINQQINAEKEQARQRSATLSAISVCLYILSLIPLIVYSDRQKGLVATIIVIAIATALLIYNRASRPKHEKYGGSSILEAIDNWQKGVANKHKFKSTLISVMWLLTVIIYIVISFITMMWYITWIIFIIASIFNIILNYIFKT